MEEKKYQVYIPYGIRNRREYFQGFGNQELKSVLLSLVVSGVISFFIYTVIGREFLATIIFLMIPLGTIVVVSKDTNNQSVVTYIKRTLKFKNEKKFYRYKGNPWSDYL